MKGSIFLEWKLRRRLKKRTLYKGINRTEKVLILFKSGDNEAEKPILEYAGVLEKQSKSVQLFSWYNGTKKELETQKSKPAFPLACKSNINWFGIPSGEIVESVLKPPFDLLFNFDLDNNPFLHYIAASSKASFKVGIGMERPEIYDFLVEPDQAVTVKKAVYQTQKSLRDIFDI